MDETPFIPFRFRVELTPPGRSEPLCRGAFSEVSGLEATMTVKALAEGGRNWGEVQLSGPVRFAPVVLKRGVTEVDDLYQWFDLVTRQAEYGLRLHGHILVLAPGGRQPLLTWKLHRALPTRFKGPDLSATANQVAIEELHLVHEGLTLQRHSPAQEEAATHG